MTRRWFALVLLAVLLIPSVATPTGNLVIPNILATLAGAPATNPISIVDANFNTIRDYVNNRELTVGLIGARPAAGVSGRYYFATDSAGGTLFFDTGVAWQQLSPSLVGSFAEALTGLALSNGASNPSTTIGIATGAASSDDAVIGNRVLMTLASAFTKTTAAWVVGTGNGCLDAGSVAASTWYHVYEIQRVDTGLVDVLCSTSASAPTFPTNYTKKRRLGSVLTDAGSALNVFTQDGDYFRWATTPTSNTPGANPGTAATLITLNTPLGVNVQAIMQIHLHASTASTSLHVSDPSANDEAPSVANPSVAPGASLTWAGIAGAAPTDVAGRVTERTNTTSQVRVRVSTSDANVRFEVFPLGWFDRRGRG